MTDEMIVALYLERSEKAIEATEKAYGRYFHSIAYGILRDDADAEEIVSDTYLKAWNIIPPMRPNPLKAFLGRITRQLSINRLKRSHAQKRGGTQYLLALDEIAECIPDSDSGTDLTELTALKDALNVFLRTLSPEARSIFILRYWHMHSISEIAKAFSVSESKVKSLLKRSREKLKKHLTEEGFGI